MMAKLLFEITYLRKMFLSPLLSLYSIVENLAFPILPPKVWLSPRSMNWTGIDLVAKAKVKRSSSGRLVVDWHV